MKLYVVGGAVRDRLLGLPAADRDWVAVGATPAELAALGYRPVGKDFPVFLHPETHEEVALARTERKVGRGYHGFSFHAAPEVTLEEDLARRDLTINAMAEADDGTLVDPFGGQRDLAARVLRHVSPAFVEDPVRLLRLARLAARFADFSVAPETQRLLEQLVAAGEVDALVPERVWQELMRGLMARRPSRMLEVLAGCGALERLLPGLGAGWQAVAPRLDAAAERGVALPVRVALLLEPLAEQAAAAAERLRADAESRWLAERLPREHATLQALAAAAGASAAAWADVAAQAPGPPPAPEALLAAFEHNDALRRPERFVHLLEASELLAGRPGATALAPLLEAVRQLPTAGIASAAAQRGLQGAAVGEAVRAARLARLASALAGAQVGLPPEKL